ncbi:MAG TPA: hypothetical protein VNZ05_04905, partial [Solirubrobacteraceae bacterium]|nr:hypothetical protein [Solirubrobacteraceae bacterium]
MATLLADPPAPPDGQGEPSPPGGAAPAAGTSMLRSCTSCAAPLAPGQDWCLQCGAGTSDSLDGHRHRWRAPAAVVSALVLLVAG